MLHTPNYDVRSRSFCGPTAISAVSGEPISVIREAVRKVRGTVKSNGHAMPVNGIATSELVAAMAVLGWTVVETAGETTGRGQSRKTKAIRKNDRIVRLGDFLDERGDEGPFIVCAGHHYFAVSHGEICDTFSQLPRDIARFDRPGSMRKKLGRNVHVKAWWRFEKIAA